MFGLGCGASLALDRLCHLGFLCFWVIDELFLFLLSCGSRFVFLVFWVVQFAWAFVYELLLDLVCFLRFLDLKEEKDVKKPIEWLVMVS